MKKLIRISILVSGICFIAGKADAQLSSDQPAMTAAQVEQLHKPQTPAKSVPVVQTASSQQAPAGAAAGAKTIIKTIAVPSQGGVVAPQERPITAIKTAPVSMQEEKVTEKEKKSN